MLFQVRIHVLWRSIEQYKGMERDEGNYFPLDGLPEEVTFEQRSEGS